MRSFRSKRGDAAAPDLGELLFADQPFAEWASEGGPLKQAWDAGPGDRRTALLQGFAADAAAETRYRLVAQTALRAQGSVTGPPGLVLGVVLEVPQGGGKDMLAAYEDASLRYFNHAGRMAFVDGGVLDESAHELLSAGQHLADVIGRWDGPRPVLPSDTARISLLCADGLYFGQGPAGVFMADPMAAPVFAAGIRVISAIMALPHDPPIDR